MDKDLKRDYERYKMLCKKLGVEPYPIEKPSLFCFDWLEHYDELLVKNNIHYNR